MNFTRAHDIRHLTYRGGGSNGFDFLSVDVLDSLTGHFFQFLFELFVALQVNYPVEQRDYRGDMKALVPLDKVRLRNNADHIVIVVHHRRTANPMTGKQLRKLTYGGFFL